VNGIVAFHNKQTRELDVSVHLNAGGDADKPVGVEVLYFTEKNKARAAKVSAAIAKASGLKDRGAKYRDNLGFLKGTDESAILIEVCFVDSKVDAKIYKENFFEICEAIAESLSDKKLPTYNPAPVKPEPAKPATKHQVIAGTFTTKENADKMAAALKKAGFDSYVK
jgi:N-acetylmuramoyl-L-alanine amidase